MALSSTSSTETVEVSSTAECEQLLRSANLGRLAPMVDGQPEVFPVNYAFAEGLVVFRTSSGLTMKWAPLSRVAFDIDQVDIAHGVAWSVVVKGAAHDLSSTLDELSARLRNMVVKSQAPGAHEALMAIYPDSISGRRFGFAPAVEAPWLPPVTTATHVERP